MKKLLFPLLLCGATAVIAQNHSVDLSTGTLNVTIPLITAQDGDVELPVALMYHGNGVRIGDSEGLVGHNWIMTAELGIRREVKGIPDDFLGIGGDTRIGWLHGDMATRIKNYAFVSDGNPSTCSDEAANYNFLNGFGYYEDTEPDVFNVNVPGLSFEFYFDENKLPQVVPYQDVVISKVTDAENKISSFTVVDSKGTQYQFAAKEEMEENLIAPNAHFLVRWSKFSDVSIKYTTSWRLTQIVSPTNGTIALEYTVKNYTDSIAGLYGGARYVYPIQITNSFGDDVVLRFSRGYSRQVLSKIVTSTTDVVFTSPTTLSRIDLYEKRLGSASLVKSYYFDYYPTYYWVNPNDEDSYKGRRSLLASIKEKMAGSMEQQALGKFYYYGSDSNGQTVLPFSDSNEKDQWTFYKPSTMLYSESLKAGSLARIEYQLGGYSAFFYEPHEYREGGTIKKGGGIRVRKIISHNGVSSTADVITEYSYAGADGLAGGKLFERPFNSIQVAVMNNLVIGVTRPTQFREIQQLITNGTIAGPIAQYFTVKTDLGLSSFEMVNASTVAYEKVTVARKDHGSRVYDFDQPAGLFDTSANNNEWQASTVDVARPSTGSSACYELGAIPLGVNVYPYPQQSNYDFARGLLLKVTDYDEMGIKVREELNEYENVYGGSAIRKIYGLALEELATYYYTSSYTNGKMFLYSKYAILTDVKKVLRKNTSIVYQSADLVKKNEKIIEYFYGTGNHREVIKIVTRNSNQVPTTTWLKYAKDYQSILTPTNAVTSALSNLNAAHRTSTVIESYTTVGADNNYTSASLTTFQTIAGKVYPYKTYKFVSIDGSNTFVPATVQTVSSNSTFTFDQGRYVEQNTILSIDSYGNVVETSGRNRINHSTIWGYLGSLPVLTVENALLQEVGFSDFEVTNACDFSIWSSPAPTYTAGRTGSKALAFPGGSTYKIVRSNVNSVSQQYAVSAWISAAGDGNVVVTVKNGATVLGTYSLPFSSSGSEFKYVTRYIPWSTGNLTVEIHSDVAATIDDVVMVPIHASFKSYTYGSPIWVSSETNNRGVSMFYDYDVWGRCVLIRDGNKNVLQKYEYQNR
jgi:hypothetical protein